MDKHSAFYMGNPTANAKDGTKISDDGSGSQPLTAVLDSLQSETVVKCAIRCDDGYKIESDTTISFSGTTADKWRVAVDNGYANATAAAQNANWQSEITLASVTSVNKVFWVKASNAGENPQNDRSVTIEAVGSVSKE